MGDVFDRFTDCARRLMGLTREESQRLGHDYIGPEHVLLGLIQLGRGAAADVLKGLDVDPRRLRMEVDRRISPGNTMVAMGPIPFAPAARRVLAHALEEAQGFGHDYIGTGHLLLGLIRERNEIAGAALAACGVQEERVREELRELLRGGESGENAPEAPLAVLRAELAGLRARVEALERELQGRGKEG